MSKKLNVLETRHIWIGLFRDRCINSVLLQNFRFLLHDALLFVPKTRGTLRAETLPLEVGDAVDVRKDNVPNLGSTN